MGMRVLITGMSATGKSSTVEALGRRGHRVVDMDDDAWSRYDSAGEWVWRELEMDALLDSVGEDESLFVAGCAINQGAFHSRFDHIVLLSIPEAVMLERLAARTTNDFGKRDSEREAILRDLEDVEPLLRAAAGVEIDTRLPLDQVVDRIEALA